MLGLVQLKIDREITVRYEMSGKALAADISTHAQAIELNSFNGEPYA